MSELNANANKFNPNTLSIPIISYPIKTPINVPKLMEEVNGANKFIPNQIPTAELFEIPIKGIDEEVMGIVYDTLTESRQINKVAIKGDFPYHNQHATSAEKQGAQLVGTKATRKQNSFLQVRTSTQQQTKKQKDTLWLGSIKVSGQFR